MGSCEATNVVFSKLKNLDPENASKIMGYLLMNLQDSELVRLASTPDHVLHALVLRVKTHLLPLLLSSSPSSPSSTSFNNPIMPIIPPRPSSTTTNPFSKSNFDFPPSSPSSHAWPPPAFLPNNNPITSPKSTPFLSYHTNAGTNFVDDHQVNEYFPFLNESSSSSSKNEDLVVDPLLELGTGPRNWQNGDALFHHRRRYSASDACFGDEEAVSGIGYKPCLYFSRGFCKNGSNCKFVHVPWNDSLNATPSGIGGGAIVGSPSKFEMLEQREEFMRLKAAQHQRLMAGTSPSSPNDARRVAAATAFAMGKEFHNFSRDSMEMNDFLAMVSAEGPNSASRQIYLTFPAESAFKDEDVSEYFSKFGPVQDVRIPYQQKRMFGFVTFVYPETVRLILSKGNPHFICDSRVLVKPYKEKGKLPDKRRQQQQQQQLARGDFSPCLSPTGFDSREPCDFHLGAGGMLYNQHDILLRRKLEEQAELQQVIELQERRLKNLQLPPDFKSNPIHHHHQRSLSVGAPLSSPHRLYSHFSNAGFSSDNIKGDIMGYCGNIASTTSSGNAAEQQQQQQQKEVDPACIGDIDRGNGKDSTDAEGTDLTRSAGERALPDNLFASPTKAAAGDDLCDLSTLAEVNESALFSASSSSHKKLELPITF